MEKNSGDRFIDVEKIIASKNPRLLKLLPGFVLHYIKKVLHEDDVNEFIAKHDDQYDIEFANEIIKEFGVTIVATGKENIPKTGGVILASNHPLGGVDGVALIKTIGEVRKDIKFFANDILMNITNLKGVFVPINKHGRHSAENISAIDKMYASDYAVPIFPAGLVSRKQSGVIKDLEWKKSFIAKAREYKRNIVPVFVDGQNSAFFYNLALWRKRLGIKANIEMFYLMDEMYGQKDKTISIIFGAPIPYSIFERRHTFTDYEWAQKVKEHVYALKSGDKSKMLI